MRWRKQEKKKTAAFNLAAAGGLGNCCEVRRAQPLEESHVFQGLTICLQRGYSPNWLAIITRQVLV